MKLHKVLAIVYLWLCGCAEHKPVRRVEVVVPRLCIESIRLGDYTECHGDDIQHLHCTGLVLTKKAECETVRVAPGASVDSKRKGTP